MKKWLSVLLALIGVLALATPAWADLKVVATTPDLAAIAKAVGGGKASVTSLALPTQDPHFVDPRPNLVLDLARADLLLAVGADLEIGWLPTLQTGSRNGNVQKGAPGYLDCSELVSLMEVPAGKIDRSMGDLHPLGNPHYLRDPRAVERVAVGVAKRMAELDSSNKTVYLEGAKRFLADLRKARKQWEEKLLRARGQKVIAYHRSLPYFADWLGITVIEHIEPRPGIPPTPSHVAHVLGVAKLEGVRVILQDSWYPSNASKLIASKVGAQIVDISMPNFAAGETWIAWMANVVKRLDAAVPK